MEKVNTSVQFSFILLENFFSLITHLQTKHFVKKVETTEV